MREADGRVQVRDEEVVAKKQAEVVEWLPRDLLPVPYYTLCLTERDYRREEKKLIKQKFPESSPTEEWANNNGATCHLFIGPEFTAALICMDGKQVLKDGRSDAAVAGMLTHEANHLYRQLLRDLNESDPGEEIECYLRQGLMVNLFAAWMDWKAENA